MKLEIFDNKSDRTIVALHGWFQNSHKRSEYFNFQKMSELDKFGEEFGWNIIFANGPNKKWTIFRTNKRIISLCEELEEKTRGFPNRTLAGFSDGSTMASYCAAYTPVYRQYILHSGLFLSKEAKEMIKDRNLSIIVGGDDGYGMIKRKFHEQVEYYSEKNTVKHFVIAGIKHSWAKDYNYLIFEE